MTLPSDSCKNKINFIKADEHFTPFNISNADFHGIKNYYTFAHLKCAW